MARAEISARRRGASLAGAAKSAVQIVVSERGYGKRSSIDDYRITRRGGKGVKTINITEKTGTLVAIKEVRDTDDLMIINRSGDAEAEALS